MALPSHPTAAPKAGQLEHLLDSLVTLVDQERNILRLGRAGEVAEVQKRISLLLEVIIPLCERLKQSGPLPAGIRSRLDFIKAIQAETSQFAQQHLGDIAGKLEQINAARSRLASIRPVYGRPAAKRISESGSSFELKG